MKDAILKLAAAAEKLLGAQLEQVAGQARVEALLGELLQVLRPPEKKLPAEPRKSKPPEEITAEDLSADERVVYDAIMADPIISECTVSPAYYARAMCKVAEFGVDVTKEVSRAAEWLKAKNVRRKDFGKWMVVSWLPKARPVASQIPKPGYTQPPPVAVKKYSVFNPLSAAAVGVSAISSLMGE